MTNATLEPPHLRLARAHSDWATSQDLDRWEWHGIATLPPLICVDGSGPAEQQTVVRVCADEHALYVRFDCDDRDIWGTYSHRDDPIYDEEVVEVFISPGAITPTQYYEFEISPDGVLFDARIENPTALRSDIVVDSTWDCQGIRWRTGRDEAARQWWAILVLPWVSLAETTEIPTIWRANFYRIERPRDANPEFSCWSPTMTEPPDFHKPAYFGLLELVENTVRH